MVRKGLIKNADIYKGWIIIKSSRNRYYAQKEESIYSGFEKNLNKLKKWIDSREK